MWRIQKCSPNNCSLNHTHKTNSRIKAVKSSCATRTTGIVGQRICPAAVVSCLSWRKHFLSMPTFCFLFLCCLNETRSFCDTGASLRIWMLNVTYSLRRLSSCSSYILWLDVTCTKLLNAHMREWRIVGAFVHTTQGHMAAWADGWHNLMLS